MHCSLKPSCGPWIGRCVQAALLWTVTAAGAAPLALEDALQLAASQHPAIAQRRSQQDAARQTLDAAERGHWPSLSGQTGKDYAGQPTLTLLAEQPLWTGGRLTAQRDAADAGVQGAAAALEESQQDILRRTATAYTELGRLQTRSAAARANVAEHQRLRTMISNRIDSQITPGSDGILMAARLAQANAELSQNLVLVTRARSTLAQLVGQPVAAIATGTPPPLALPLLESCIDAALAFSPTLKRLQAQADSAEAEARVRHGQALPQLTLRHEVTQGGQAPLTSTFLALEYKTGAGLSSLSLVREAEAQYQSLLAGIEMEKRNTIEAVSADWADLQSLTAQTGDLQAQVQAQGQLQESYLRQYVIGRKNWIELLNEQRELAQARYALADTQWGVLRSQLRLQLSTGELRAATLALPNPVPSE